MSDRIFDPVKLDAYYAFKYLDPTFGYDRKAKESVPMQFDLDDLSEKQIPIIFEGE